MRLVIIILFTSVIASQDLPKIVTQKMTTQVSILHGASGIGCNVGLLHGSDGILLVDAMNGKGNQQLYESILAVSKQPIRYILNSHSDFDHSGGNKFLAKKGARIIGQANSRFSSVFNHQTFKEKLEIKFNNEIIELHAVISHSYNDAIIYFKKANIIFMGDTYTNSWHPSFSNGGIEGQLKAVDIALSLGDRHTKIIPGHGVTSNKSGLRDFRQKCSDWIRRIGELNRLAIKNTEMASDPELNELRQKFIHPSMNKRINDQRFLRLIDRTLSSDFVIPFPFKNADLNRFIGSYVEKDQSVINIIKMNNALYAQKESSFIVKLIPIAENRFHLRGWMTDEFIFSFSKNKQVISLLYDKGVEQLRFKKLL